MVDWEDGISKTVGVVLLKVDENNVPSVLLTKEKPEPGGKPAGWGIPQGRKEPFDKDEVEAALREFTGETRREITKDQLETAFRWESTFIPSRSADNELHQIIWFLVIVDKPPLVVVDFNDESKEVEDVRWFRLNQLPDAKYGAGMYRSHRERLAEVLRAAAERPEMFKNYGLDAEELAQIVNSKSKKSKKSRRPK